MAKLIHPLSEQELKQATLVSLRKDYGKLSNFYQRIINGELTLCPKCGQWKSTKINFYQSNTSPDGVEHYGCRECILNDCTDYDKATDTRIDNREKTIETFKRLNWYFDENVYNDQLKILADGVGEKVRGTAAQQWITIRASLNDYKFKTFADSVFSDEDEETLQLTSKRTPRKEIIKIFGSGFTSEDYLYLQDQYDDWRTVDMTLPMELLKRIEANIQRYVKLNITEDFEFYFHYVSVFDLDEKMSQRKDKATLGIDAMDYATLDGSSPSRVVNNAFMMRSLGLMNYFTPLSSSYTQSGTSGNEGGGQTKNEDDLSDEGLATREGEKDTGTQAGQ